MPKLPPPPPPQQLAELGADVVAVAEHTTVWRIHVTVGEHVLAWNVLRSHGPTQARFDPHRPEPAGDPELHLEPGSRQDVRARDEGVLYLAVDIQTCLAEVFQATRIVNRRRHSPYLTGFNSTRTLHLLDLTDTWPTRAGASQALNSGRTDRSRAWARAIRAAYPDLDGLWYPSSMNANQPCLALFTPAADALPAEPRLSLPLSHPGLAEALATATHALGYGLL